MTSYQQFTPGKKSNSRKILQYIAEYNATIAAYNNLPQLTCVCTQDKFDKSLSFAGSLTYSSQLFMTKENTFSKKEKK